MLQCPLCHHTEACDECATLGLFCFGVRPVTRAQIDAFHAVLDRRGKPEPTEEDILSFVNDVACAFNGTVK